MKNLIVFMSRHGTTRKIAHQIAEKLGTELTTLVDLKTDEVPDLKDFDTIMIGGSIHIGQIQKDILEFCVNNKETLLQKRVGLFMCGVETHELKEEFDNAFPEWLRNHAIAHGLFGGELLLEEMHFFEKAMVKGIYGIKKSMHEVDHNAIESFENKMAEDTDPGKN